MSLDIVTCPIGSNTTQVMTITHTLPDTITHTLHIPETNNNTISKTPLIIKLQPGVTIFGAGKGKRGPTGPIVTTSDEDESPDSPLNSPRAPALKTPEDRAFSPPMLDHDYDNVSSPGNSSTASGPTYVRPPGFTHHAQEITVSKPRIKKKKTALLGMKDGLRRRDPTPPKSKPRRDPVPMRMRALPQSFWQQPNVPHNVSPATAYPILPPLFNSRDDEQISDVRPITPPAEERTEKDKPTKHHRTGERKINIANTDLLFKLFENVEKDVKKTPSTHMGKEHLKSRSQRQRKVIPVSTNKTMLSGEDPYLVDGVTDKLFPQLRLEQTKGYTCNSSMSSGTSMLHIITLKDGDKSISLPALSVEQNYSQMLSELVAHI